MTTTTAPATFTLTATFELGNASVPQWVTAEAIVPTPADAEAIAAMFPKSHKVRGWKQTQPIDGFIYANGTEVVGCVQFQVRLVPDQANGGRNETGIKRYRAFRKAAARLGFHFEFNGQGEKHINAYRTEADLHAAIDG